MDLWSETETSPISVEPTSLLSDEERKEIDKEDGLQRKPVRQRKPLNLKPPPDEEEEESVAEEEETAEGAEEEEEAAEPSRPQPKLESTEPKPPQFTVEQVFQHNRTLAIKQWLQQNGAKINADNSNIQEEWDKIVAENPYAATKVDAWADAHGRQVAEQYHKEFVAPYLHQRQQHDLVSYITRYKELTPDIEQYLDAMDALAPELIKRFPEFRQNVAAAIPLLYQLAKEKKLSKVVKTASKVITQGKTALEGSGARTSKAARGGTGKAEADVERVFGRKDAHQTKLEQFFGQGD